MKQAMILFGFITLTILNSCGSKSDNTIITKKNSSITSDLSGQWLSLCQPLGNHASTQSIISFKPNNKVEIAEFEYRFDAHCQSQPMPAFSEVASFREIGTKINGFHQLELFNFYSEIKGSKTLSEIWEVQSLDSQSLNISVVYQRYQDINGRIIILNQDELSTSSLNTTYVKL